MDWEDELRAARDVLDADAAHRRGITEAADAIIRERDAVRAAYESREVAAADNVATLLKNVIGRLRGVPPERHELRPPPPSPEPPRRGLFRRAATSPVEEVVWEAHGWIFGEGDARRVITPEGRVYRFGRWHASSQGLCLEEWALISVRRAARIYHTLSDPSDDSMSPIRITKDRFGSTFALPMQPDGVARMDQLVAEWVEEQRRACVLMLRLYGQDV